MIVPPRQGIFFFFLSGLGVADEFIVGLVEFEVFMENLVKITSTKLNIINLS